MINSFAYIFQNAILSLYARPLFYNADKYFLLLYASIPCWLTFPPTCFAWRKNKSFPSLSEETKRKIGLKSKGRKQPQATIEKRTQAVLEFWKNMTAEEREIYLDNNYRKENNNFYGKHHSGEAKKE